MIRFLFGLILGGAVSALGLGAAAVLNPLPEGPVSKMPMAASLPAPAPAPEPSPTPEPEPAPAPEPEPEPAPDPAPAPEPEPAPAPEATDSSTAPVAPAAPETPQAAGLTGSTAPDAPDGPALSAPSLGGASSGGLSSGGDSSPVRTASAPQVSVSAPTAEGGPSVDTESAAVPQVGDVAATDYAAIVRAAGLPSGNALFDNAAIFNGDLSKPLMGIVLIDEGGAEALRSGLTALSAPITFGVAADLENAGGVSKTYRDAGFEVIAVLADGALTTESALEDVPLRLAEAIEAVPNAASILDPMGGVIREDRDIMQTALQTVKITGHGLLTFAVSGPNTVPQFADEIGVRSDVVTRVIDAEPGGANIALALEQAVQDARRTGAVIVAARMQQETVTSLFQWLLGADPRDITIAPVSVVLR